MKTLGNILWLLLTGFWLGISYAFLGLIWCITIIGIPFGKQCFKLAGLIFWPFGKDVDLNFAKHAILNILWIIFGGLGLCIGFFFSGILWCITIIGIPFGKQCFKFAKLSLMPFGATVAAKQVLDAAKADGPAEA